MVDKLRRCPARDTDGHRCKKHIYHLREVQTQRGVELPAEDGNHRAFGKEWAD